MGSKLIKMVMAGCFVACASLHSGLCQTVLPYRTDSVVFDGIKTGLHYGATITTPNDGSRHTAVVLVSGTGVQDRDGNMGGHKLFADIADNLTRKGIVVLRVDDRGIGKSNGDYSTSTTADFAADVLEAFHYLQARPEVNSKHIGLIGHSEGGISISLAAAKEPKVAFLISIAGLCMDGYNALIIQNRDLVNAAPISNDDKNRYYQINEIMFKTARQYADSANMDKVLNERYAAWKKTDDEWVKAHNIQFDHFRFPIWSYVKDATGPWYRFFIKYDPTPVLAKVNIPILALNGDKDLMVSYKENLANWKKLPAAGQDKDVTTVVLPSVNHLFLPCQSCTSKEYATIKSPFSPEALVIMDNWIKKRF